MHFRVSNALVCGMGLIAATGCGGRAQETVLLDAGVMDSAGDSAPRSQAPEGRCQKVAKQEGNLYSGWRDYSYEVNLALTVVLEPGGAPCGTYYLRAKSITTQWSRLELLQEGQVLAFTEYHIQETITGFAGGYPFAFPGYFTLRVAADGSGSSRNLYGLETNIFDGRKPLRLEP